DMQLQLCLFAGIGRAYLSGSFREIHCPYPHNFRVEPDDPGIYEAVGVVGHRSAKLQTSHARTSVFRT
ncbi:MAG: hypothetical protein DMF40_04360, partial [Verrucomicrobia bacterium]